MSEKRLGVIILNWNGLELMKRYVPIASKYTRGEAELVVADNGSTDGSIEWLAENHPEVRVIPFPENYGFAEGYNKALRAGGYPYTVLLNSDVEVTEGWWEPLLRALERDSSIGAIQPKIRALKERGKFEYAGAAGGLLDRYGYPYCRGRLFDSIEEDNGQYDDGLVDVAWASGACMAVNTATYEKLGGLDRDFFAHMEEIDLCCRMIAAGYRVCATSESHVFHLGGGTLPQGNSRKVYLNFRNNLLLLHKNLPKQKGRKVLFLRRLADTLALVMYLAKGEFGDAKAIWDAHRDFRKMRKNYTNLPAEDKLSTLPGANRKIVIDYYLKRQKK
ncbi:MAG: glycosyltransferase family 2 protein [Clostridium sp.]|nr:glycosyltransferase family 2 protein [Prevotella sp.]MCM1428888.1 glycosyltransferase family 2 protein [Clostridium sp.]MCM1475267.1 glycosyltransferase family 2 protein [Muribaculaceae bacterium]